MKIVVLSIAFFNCLYLSYGQSGDLDLTFGVNGIVTTDMGSAFNYHNIGSQVLVQSDGGINLIIESSGCTFITRKNADGSQNTNYGSNGYSISVPFFNSHAALQTDGKIVVFGNTLNHTTYDGTVYLAVARFNIDGSLDTAFGMNGIQVTINGTSANSLAIQRDGKIVGVGQLFDYNSSSQAFVSLVRYNTDGSLDDSFAGGWVQTYLGYNGYTNAVAIQSDGKILVGGSELLRYAQNGILDSSFNGDGHQFIYGVANTIAIQSDGKIIVAANRDEYDDSEKIDFAISRYYKDGGLDSTFDGDGMQTAYFDGVNEGVTSMVIQSNGKIVVAGYTANVNNVNNINFAIARFDTDGSLDTSFSGDGKQTTGFDSISYHVKSIAIQNNGKLVALGYSANGVNTYVAAARYNIDGNLDNSFDVNGILSDHLNQGSTFYTSTVIQTDGKILAAGYSWNGSNYDFTLVRYNINGSLDSAFSGDGKQMTDFGSTDDKGKAIVIQNDGKILVAGSAGDNFGLARYDTDGSLDISFDGDGMQTTDFGSVDSATSIVIQNDGKILVGGSALDRYNSNGSLDLNFDGDGKMTVPFDSGHLLFSCNDLTISNDGKIVIASSDYYSFIVSRYNTNGSIDSTFGINGVQFIDSRGLPANVKSVLIQNDGKILISGSGLTPYKTAVALFALMRLNIDGMIDSTFNGGEVMYTGIDYISSATSMIIQRDNKIILGGYTYTYNGGSDDFTLMRFNTDGSLDNTFGSNGIVITQASVAYDQIWDLAITGNKLYAVGNGQYPGSFGVVARYIVSPDGPFTTAANGDWNDPDTWIGGVVPYSTSKVIVQHNVTITTNTTCYSLNIETATGYLIINPGLNLTITH